MVGLGTTVGAGTVGLGTVGAGAVAVGLGVAVNEGLTDGRALGVFVTEGPGELVGAGIMVGVNVGVNVGVLVAVGTDGFGT